MSLVNREKLGNIKDFLCSPHIPKGSIVEVGVYRGGSLAFLAQHAGPGRQVFGFDTFEGIPHHDESVDPVHRKGSLSADIVTACQRVAGYGNVTIIQGVFPDVLQGDFDLQDEMNPIALAHLDVDVYQSYLESLPVLWAYLAPGGRLYMDDVGVPWCRGADIAVRAWVAQQADIEVHSIPRASLAQPQGDSGWEAHYYLEKPRGK